MLSPRAKSMRVEAMLRQAGSPACLDVAAALRELWTVGAYTSDVRPENVGRARNGAYKLLDLGAACVEGAAKAAEEQQAGSRRKMGPMTVAQVAYEDATSPFYTRVSSCLLSLGSVDPDEDIGRMPPGYVANAESAGMDPGVVAATIYTSTTTSILSSPWGWRPRQPPLPVGAGRRRRRTASSIRTRAESSRRRTSKRVRRSKP